MNAITAVLLAAFIPAVTVAYLLGRRSKVDAAIDRRLDRELYQPNLQEQADRAEREGRE